MGVRQFSASGAGRACARAVARAVAVAAAALLVSGCIIVGYEQPPLNLDVPDSYTAARKGPDSALPALDWWRGFGSRELIILMEEAQTANFDVAAAVARILQADAQARIANAALLPTIDGNFSATHSRVSTAGGGGRGGGSLESSLYNLNLSASYTLDFWGRNRATLLASEQNAIASRFDKDVVALTALVSVANTYFNLLDAQDRLRVASAEKARVTDALEAAMKIGQGKVNVWPEDGPGKPWRFSSTLHCADCDIGYSEPTPAMFSFNSPLGACDTCRGFGRVIGIDLGLVVPDPGKTLREGAVKPWQTESFKECQRDLEKYAPRFDVALDLAWKSLSERERRWVIDGDPGWRGKWQTQWYGIRRYFEWLESKAYKMHIRVLLSRYRSYTPCTACGGSRLQPDALLWRYDGHTIQQLVLMPLARLREFFDRSRPLGAPDQAIELLLKEIRARLRFLSEVGLGYLTLDRQSRTLSGGEVQRINLTTALGTSLVNTLFVLDEPSIGLHPRDMQRVIGVMKRLRDAGNSLVVVEHDPQIMLEADRILDLGPGAGERGGRGPSQLRPVESHASPESEATLPDERLAGHGTREYYRLGGKAARGGSMQVSEILKVKGNALFTIAPDGRLSEAVSVMAEHNMGSLVVMDRGRMVGMLTFKEILRALEKGRGALGESKVGDIMERDPVTAGPGMEVNDLRRTMIDSGARYLPVMERDRLIGVVSFRDVAKAVLEEQDFENRMLKGYIKNWPE